MANYTPEDSKYFGWSVIAAMALTLLIVSLEDRYRKSEYPFNKDKKK